MKFEIRSTKFETIQKQAPNKQQKMKFEARDSYAPLLVSNFRFLASNLFRYAAFQVPIFGKFTAFEKLRQQFCDLLRSCLARMSPVRAEVFFFPGKPVAFPRLFSVRPKIGPPEKTGALTVPRAGSAFSSGLSPDCSLISQRTGNALSKA